jgi:cardiolipin-specific phospholipase
MAKAPMRFKALIGTARTFWRMGMTPMSVLRKMPEGRGKALVDGYVFNRMKILEEEVRESMDMLKSSSPTQPNQTTPNHSPQILLQEKTLLAGYFYNIGCLPGSGEYCLQNILDVGVLAKEPLVDRIPKLKLSSPVGMLYGTHDWMDVSGGLQVQKAMEEDAVGNKVKVDVRRVKDAGHLLNLENPDECNRILADLVSEKSGSDPSKLNWKSTTVEGNRI